jgi:ABC-type transport system substrate-binding protein
MRYNWLVSSLTLLTSACSTASPEQAQVAAPIHIRWSTDPIALDPLTFPNQNAAEAVALLHLSLLQNDYQTDSFTACLAEQLPTVQFVGDSVTRLEYHLRPAAKWDDGRPVLATDVDFTLKLMQCPGLPNEMARTQFSFIRQVLPDPVDPRHFTLVCRGQAVEMINASGDFPILPEAALDAQHTLRALPLAVLQDWPAAKAPLPPVAALVRRYQSADIARTPGNLPGCGPYRLVVWEHNRHVLFSRKATWWADSLHAAPFVLQARPQLLDYLIMPEDAAATIALRRHELDVYPHMPARSFQQLQTSESVRREFAFYTEPSYDVVVVGFNTSRATLRDKLTRQALSRLLDPAGLLAATQLGQGSLTVGLLPPTNPFYNDSLAALTYAPSQAQALLLKAGWQRQSDGNWQQPGSKEPLALALRYRADDATFATIALQFRAAAAKLGIIVTLLPTEANALSSALKSGDFDICVRTLKGSPFGLNFSVYFHSKAIGASNFSRFNQYATDHLLEAIEVESNRLRKRHLLRNFQELIRDEVPLVPLFFLSNRLVTNKQLRHVVTSGLKPGYAVQALTWAQTDSLASGPTP